MQQSRTILVTGATGAQGGAAAEALLEKGFNVRALVRDTGSSSARSLAQQGVELSRGDFEDPVSLQAAMSGIHGVFSVQLPPTPQDPDVEVRTGRYLVEAARDAGVDTFVHTSVARADEQASFIGWDEGRWWRGYWNSKSAVNDLVRAAGFPHWTILKPALMMDNFIGSKARWMFPSLAHGVIETAMHEGTRIDLIATEDVGKFAAAAFTDPDRFNEHEIGLAAEALTMSEIAQILSEASGRPVAARALTEAEMVASGAVEVLVSSQVWANVEGYKVDIDALKQWRVPLTPFRDWIAGGADRLEVG
jgi:uncharacterized protein YbjT (DUF2867 family)